MYLWGAEVQLGERPSDIESRMVVQKGDRVERCHITIRCSADRPLDKPLLEIQDGEFHLNCVEVENADPAKGIYISVGSSADVTGNIISCRGKG